MEVALQLPQPTEFVHEAYSRLSAAASWFGYEQVLDLSCWFGQLTKEVLQPICESRHAHIVAVDRAFEAIELAQFRFPHRDIDYRVVDTSSRKSIPEDLRQVFTKAFHFGNPLRTPEQQCVLDVMSWFLADGAECILVLPLHCCVYPTIARLAASDLWKGYMLEFERLIPPQYNWADAERIFYSKSEKNGLKVTLTDVKSTSVKFQSEAQFREYLRLTIPFATRIPEERRAQFLGRAFELAMQSGACPAEDGSIVHQMDFLIGLCKKVRDV